MRSLLLFLVFISLHFSSYSQKKKTKSRPIPPPALNEVELSADTLTLQEGAMPVLFEWEMNADTTLKSGTIFKEIIRLKYGETGVDGLYSLQNLQLKKVKGKPRVPATAKLITRKEYYNAGIANGIVTLTERDSIVMRLKVHYDSRKQLSYLQDLKNKRIYRHIESDEPMIDVAIHP